jgi:hypothetical protein
MNWTAGVRFPAGVRDFSLPHNVQTGSGVHPAFYPVGTGALKKAHICGVRGCHSVIAKTTAFWGVTPCFLVDVSAFRRELIPPSSGQKSMPIVEVSGTLGLLFYPKDR